MKHVVAITMAGVATVAGTAEAAPRKTLVLPLDGNTDPTVRLRLNGVIKRQAVKLDGTVKNLSVDGIAGFRLFGGDDSKLTVDARAGFRYQRMAISGSIGLSGSGFSPAPIVDAGADMLAGARVVVRPFPRLAIEGTVDQSLFGSSTSTWSAGAEVNVRVISRLVVIAGWRTLTQQKAAISTVMHGPRVALQLLF